MKQVMLMAILCLYYLFGYSQNGGQLNENNVLKIEYVGYNTNHIFKVINKVNCELIIKMDKNGSFNNMTLTPLQETFIHISGPQSTVVNFKAKRQSGALCKQNPDNGWVELNSLIILPIKWGPITTIRINPNLIKVTFETEEDNTIKHYNIMISEDGKTFKKANILFPNGIIGHKKYSVFIKL